MPGQLRWLVALLCVALAASACDSALNATSVQSNPETKNIEAVVRAYYDAVQRDDVEAQAGLWTPSAQEEARQQAQAWSARGKEELKPTAVHVVDTEEPQRKIVHYYLLVKDRSVPEGKAALMENVGGAWRFRELH